MTAPQALTENAVARHIAPEDFKTAAAVELAASPPWQFGVCFLPECGRRFTPARDWQIYCCTACERRGTAELRKWGHRLALPSLIWRIGKYEQSDPDRMALTRAARRHFTRLQTAWVDDRKRREKEVGQI